MKEFLDLLLVVIVIYRQKIESTAAWKSLLDEATGMGHPISLLAYDNGHTGSKLPTAKCIQLHYHRNGRNPGVSAAYNHANRVAIGLGKLWLLLLDQDTEVPKGTLARYQEAIQHFPEECLFAPRVFDRAGLLSPYKYRLGGGRRLKVVKPGLIPLKLYKVVNSGLLVRCRTFEAVGGFDENVPLDFSDLAFLVRAENEVQHICLVDATVNTHFSGTAGFLTATEALSRFGKYCLGARSFAFATGRFHELRFRSLARAIKMSIRYRHFGFIKTYNGVWS